MDFNEILYTALS